MNRFLTLAAIAACPSFALAGDVSVQILGSVDSNAYSSGPFGGFASGTPVSLSFEVFVPGTDVTPGQATNYAIDLPTFVIDINGPLAPTLAGPTNCLIQNDNPGADGLRIFQTQLDSGHFFTCELGANGMMWGSNDITMIEGTYDFLAFISSFGYSIQGQGGFMEIFPDTIIIGGGFDSFCFGDGGDQMGCTPCPCTNEAPLGSGGGCLNSAGQSAVLAGGGSDSVLAGDLTFALTGGNVSTFGVLTSGDNLLPNMGRLPCGIRNRLGRCSARRPALCRREPPSPRLARDGCGRRHRPHQQRLGSARRSAGRHREPRRLRRGPDAPLPSLLSRDRHPRLPERSEHFERGECDVLDVDRREPTQHEDSYPRGTARVGILNIRRADRAPHRLELIEERRGR